ncbi:2'-5' RNA ligase family protein [Saccharomonospora sp.]|uniref:2'-5' RNA ligase family protein n=1 Tax=Saccharomonospora sp. TaxID=33913 RepID=UPI002611A888|nr:2'-5' RNA ligase family protein [Saccharomonospora sp.]
MALAVCLLFDQPSERALRGLWSRLEEFGVATLQTHTHGRHHPHLSYVVLLDWDLDAVRAAVEALPDGGSMELTFDALAAFPRGRISLVPLMSAELLARQRAVVRAVSATGANVYRHYAVDRWLPHTSVATRATTSQLPTVASSVYDILPLTVRVSRAALIDSSTGQRWSLPSLP